MARVGPSPNRARLGRGELAGQRRAVFLVAVFWNDGLSSGLVLYAVVEIERQILRSRSESHRQSLYGTG